MTSPYDQANKILALALERCAAGESSAFSEIYDVTAPKFTAIVKDMVGCEEAARDILQRAYLSIWMNARNYDPEKAKPFTWMLVIMRNRALDHLRERKRSKEHQELDEKIEDKDAKSPDQQARLQQAASMLTAQLSVLPVLTAQAILLHVTEGYSCHEIGERLGAPPNTVKSWIRRGLQRMRAELPYQTFDAAL
ncbi:sigma-70 family RNA polymerase sigma factor [Hyphomonas sp.]|uniref:RNA polymerase sigma factor n=1 Tax=Hyphomonas sp. TaxID=87 RepID=UPI0025BDB563|nr:sigma-70 family RNA polymerase sigma factor [Hyphomonas sp.]MBI1399402.1 sigma-70 family RNA polymerase sigma factor [Hyphomonas sp.]